MDSLSQEATLSLGTPYVEQARRHKGWALAFANATAHAPGPARNS